MNEHSARDSKSVAAVVTYWLLAIWSLMIICVFHVIHDVIKIDGLLQAMVSGPPWCSSRPATGAPRWPSADPRPRISDGQKPHLAGRRSPA